jgi:hypothetical protein
MMSHKCGHKGEGSTIPKELEKGSNVAIIEDESQSDVSPLPKEQPCGNNDEESIDLEEKLCSEFGKTTLAHKGDLSTTLDCKEPRLTSSQLPDSDVVKEQDDNDYHVECETSFVPVDHHDNQEDVGVSSMDDHMLEDGEINEERPKLEVMHISDSDGELVPTVGSLSDFFLFNSRRGPFFLSFDEDPHYYEDDKIKYDSGTTTDPEEKCLSSPDTHLDLGSFWR